MKYLNTVIGIGIGVVALIGFAHADAEKLRIVAIGDSTTSGAPRYRSPIESPPAGKGDIEHQFVYWMQKASPDWNVLNAGVNTERIDQIAKRMDRDAFSMNPDRIILMAGVNDVYQGYSEKVISERLSKLYAEMHQKNIPFIACSILPYNTADKKALRKIQSINSWIEVHSKKWNGQFCDTYEAVEHPLRQGTLVSTDDGLHPDKKAHQLLAKTIISCLESSLK